MIPGQDWISSETDCAGPFSFGGALISPFDSSPIGRAHPQAVPIANIITPNGERNSSTSDVSWPAHAGHPGDEGLTRPLDTRRLGGPVKPGHDNILMAVHANR